MELQKEQSLSLSIIMPCLNEEQSVGYCVDEAKTFLDRCALDGEIIVVDNALDRQLCRGCTEAWRSCRI